MFAKIGRWCFRNRGKVVLAWLAVLIVVGGLSSMIGTAYSTEFTLPDVESRRASTSSTSTSAVRAPAGGGTIVFRAEQGVNDPEVQAAMTAFFAEPSGTRTSRRQPLRAGGGAADRLAGPGRRAGRLRRDRDARDTTFEEAKAISAELRALMPAIAGLQIEIGGAMLAEFEAPSVRAARPRLRHRHPDPRLRLGARHGPARSASPWPASASGTIIAGLLSQRPDDARLRHDARRS